MTERHTKLAALGQSLVDEVFQVSDLELADLGYGPNEQRQIAAADYCALRAKVSKAPTLVSTGGAVVNTIYTHAVLGGESTLVTRLGNDENARVCLNELNAHQIKTVSITDNRQPTGTSLIFVSQDGSRAIVTCLGAAAELFPHEITAQNFPADAAIMIEGYMAGIPGGYPLKLHRELFQRGHRLAFILAAPWIASNYAEAVKEILSMSSTVFVNEAESVALTGLAEHEKAAEALGTKTRLAVVTAGAKGVWLSQGQGTTLHVPAFTVQAVDTTGAGDSFAGAMVRGLLLGLPAERAARAAAYVASVVVSQVGAKVPHSVRKGWEKLAFE